MNKTQIKTIIANCIFRLGVMPIVCITFVLPAYGKHLDVTDSVAQSKRQGTFVRTVPVTPKSFNWEGHEVVVTESWIDQLIDQRGERTYLSFRLKIDGGRFKEDGITKGENKRIRFENAYPNTGPLYKPDFFYIVRTWNYLVGGTSGVVHLVRVKKPLPDKIYLRAITYTTEHERTRKPDSPILTFHLQ